MLAPNFSSLEAASRDEVLSYARSLEFDDSHFASDPRRLMIRSGDGFSPGPLATIMSEVGVVEASLEELGAGRIMAIVVIDGEFPARGFTEGENFLWVDNANGSFGWS